ncbi:helix-turn-helix transcriptional regulator [Clostridium sp.]|uniref:ArsR/SmtB family transcription factor n=1 Tax=Clostridium sp. TaxID=1506 RepID=UPI00262AB2A3|nr:metalloregulator ArsR/SmtB family transcription factor [Clostridium sp.]
MNTEYEMNAKILKALSDPNRLKIIDLLSCGEKCACEILESFNFTQPTLSHHMKVLIDCGLIEMRKDSIWNQYRLNMKNANRLVLFLLSLVTEKNECICSNQNHIKCDNLKSTEEYT